MQYRSLLINLIIKLSHSYNLEYLFNNFEIDVLTDQTEYPMMHYMNLNGVSKSQKQSNNNSYLLSTGRSFHNCLTAKIQYVGTNMTCRIFSNGIVAIIYSAGDRIQDDDCIRTVIKCFGLKNKYEIQNRLFQYIFKTDTIIEADSVITEFRNTEYQLTETMNKAHISIDGIKVVVQKNRNLIHIIGNNKSIYRVVDLFGHYRQTDQFIQDGDLKVCI